MPAAASAAGSSSPPRDMLEATLALVWSELLGTKAIGVHDHFFEIGGHSLLAARLVDAVERRTGVAIPLTALFADDTIAGMASMLRDGARFADEPITALHDDPARAAVRLPARRLRVRRLLQPGARARARDRASRC